MCVSMISLVQHCIALHHDAKEETCLQDVRTHLINTFGDEKAHQFVTNIMDTSVSEFIVKASESIASAKQVLQSSGMGVLFVINNRGQVVGVIDKEIMKANGSGVVAGAIHRAQRS
jgi:predicted transcriptional regulator